jgi:hypothetical protein
MKRTIAVILIVMVLAIGLGTFYMVRAAKGPSASAEIHIIRPYPDLFPKPFTPDDFATQSARLTSRDVALRAIRHGKLDELPSFKNADVVSQLMDSLSISRPGDYSNNLLLLETRGISGPDGVAMLEAVIAAYQDVLREAGRAKWEESVKAAEERVKESDRKYNYFVKSMPAGTKLPVANSDIGKQAAGLTDALNNARIEQKKYLITIQSLKKIQDEEGDERLMQVVEAIKLGKGPSPSEVFAGLNTEKASVESKIAGLQKEHDSLIPQMRDLTQYETTEQMLKGECKEAKKALDEAIKELKEFDLGKKSTDDIRAYVIVKPHRIK